MVTALSFSAATGVFGNESGAVPAVLSQVEIQDAQGNAVESVDVVTGATVVLNVMPMDEGATYGEYEARNETRGDYLWFGEEVTFVLGRYVDGELYIADRFANGEWGAVRVGWGRRNFLFVHLSEENNRTDVSLIEPGSYNFRLFAISGNADMPNPPVSAEEYAFLEGAPSVAFVVNVLAAEGAAGEQEAEEPLTAVALVSAHQVLIDEEPVSFRAFNIGGNNFFMLRDIAYALSGSGSQFEVEWDGELQAISLTTGLEYTIVGGEMNEAYGTQAMAIRNTDVAVYIDAEAAELLSYNIGGNNFFMLRDLGQALGFEVDWDYEAEAVLISTN